MLVCYKVAVCIDSKRSGTAELILRLQEIEGGGFFVGVVRPNVSIINLERRNYL